MQLPTFFITDFRDRCHRIEALCILISRLRGHRLYKLSQEFGRDETSLSGIADAIADFIHRTWGHLLEWNAFLARTVPRLPAYVAAIRAQGAPVALNVFAFIDGTFRSMLSMLGSFLLPVIPCRPIARPSTGGQMGAVQRSVYSGHQVL